jgi:hypothetical protein
MIFNRYLNPLMVELEREARVYGYADDLAVLCESL